MQFNDVATFIEVARQGSVSRAAAVLYVSQPTLTARLQHLEHEIGEPLFVRGRRGARLTEAGIAFLPYAERALGTLAEGHQLLSHLREGATGELTVGGAPAVSTYVLPLLLKQLLIEHPSVRLVVRTGHSEEVLAMVLSGQVQVGLIRSLPHPDIEAQLIYEDELVLAVQPGHPFAEHRRVTLAEVARETFVMFDRSSSYHALTSAAFRELGLVPRSVLELDNIEAAKKCVTHGLGVALLPRIALAEEVAYGSLQLVAIKDLVVPLRGQVVAIRRRDAGPPSIVTQAFLALLPGVTGLLEQILHPLPLESAITD